MFHTPFEEVTDLQRRNAKAVNFGIVYGISSFGLSQDLSITKKEAAQYIESYFETYPSIKGFLDDAVEHAKENGYVTTVFGRRRPVPELSKLVLQVHDELLIEAYEEELEDVKEILSHEMVNAAKLHVPLEVDMHTGKNWYEAK